MTSLSQGYSKPVRPEGIISVRIFELIAVYYFSSKFWMKDICILELSNKSKIPLSTTYLLKILLNHLVIPF